MSDAILYFGMVSLIACVVVVIIGWRATTTKSSGPFTDNVVELENVHNNADYVRDRKTQAEAVREESLTETRSSAESSFSQMVEAFFDDVRDEGYICVDGKPYFSFEFCSSPSERHDRNRVPAELSHYMAYWRVGPLFELLEDGCSIAVWVIDCTGTPVELTIDVRPWGEEGLDKTVTVLGRLDKNCFLEMLGLQREGELFAYLACAIERAGITPNEAKIICPANGQHAVMTSYIPDPDTWSRLGQTGPYLGMMRVPLDDRRTYNDSSWKIRSYGANVTVTPWLDMLDGWRLACNQVERSIRVYSLNKENNPVGLHLLAVLKDLRDKTCLKQTITI